MKGIPFLYLFSIFLYIFGYWKNWVTTKGNHLVSPPTPNASWVASDQLPGGPITSGAVTILSHWPTEGLMQFHEPKHESMSAIRLPSISFLSTSDGLSLIGIIYSVCSSLILVPFVVRRFKTVLFLLFFYNPSVLPYF